MRTVEEMMKRMGASFYAGMFLAFAVDRLAPWIGIFDWPMGAIDLVLASFFGWRAWRVIPVKSELDRRPR